MPTRLATFIAAGRVAVVDPQDSSSYVQVQWRRHGAQKPALDSNTQLAHSPAPYMLTDQTWVLRLLAANALSSIR